MAEDLPAATPGPVGATDPPGAPHSPDGSDGSGGSGGTGGSGTDGTVGTVGTGAGPDLQVTRTVDVEADVDAVWQAVADPAERALWLDDADALARRVRVDEALPGQRLVWTWWRPGDEGDASTVAVELRPADGGGTRVVVTETLPAMSPRGAGTALARAGGVVSGIPLARAGGVVSGIPLARAGGVASGIARGPAGAVRRAPGWLRCTADSWDRRILGLELLFVAARVATA